MKTWYRLLFQPGMKTHVVSEEMKDELLEELCARGAEPYKTPEGLSDVADVAEFAHIKAVDAWYLEFGGMVHKDEPDTEIGDDVIEGLTLTARADHVEPLFSTHRRLLKEDPRILKSGIAYRKIYAWISCIVVTPAEYTLFLNRLQQLVPKAEADVDAFYKMLDQKWKLRS